MATFRPSTSPISSATYLGIIRASIHTHQRHQETNISIFRYSNKDHPFVGFNKQKNQTLTIKTNPERKECSRPNSSLIEEMYAIMDIVADRVEMHRNIGEQRNNWNHLLLTSVNSMTATAAIMAGIAAGTAAGSALVPLKLSSALLYLGATGILIIMNKIQPSQLAEEQRNASRLFKQLHAEIGSNIALKRTSSDDVERITEKVLALDKAYPLALLGVMLDKFPERVEPAVWWPQHMDQSHNSGSTTVKGAENGWSQGLEEEMREILSVLRRKDDAEYIKLGNTVLKINKILAVCGPMLTGLAATGVGFIGSPFLGLMPSLFGIVLGALATIVNTIEHGGQMGMVFEMYRSSAGFFKLMEENIETTLEQRQEIRENGQVFEEKVALELGRNLSELRDLASASCSRTPNSQEFASKLF
ncbi:probable F-box protein At4g22030 [Primulina huaijiensis]|uniref:probable F-box protein At4g22030 n=1 Tax=Primulina huaijiensis TaxID=1492673 RepID=UPI003CC757BA